MVYIVICLCDYMVYIFTGLHGNCQLPLLPWFTDLQLYRCIRLYGYIVMCLFGYMVYRFTALHGFNGNYGFTFSWHLSAIPEGLQVYRCIWFYDIVIWFTGLQLYMVIMVYKFAGLQVYRFTGLQVY